MDRLKKILGKLYRSPWLKYWIVTLLAVLLIGFIDENSVWHHFKNQELIEELEQDIQRQKDQYNQDNAKIKKLSSDPKAIEKIARERYFMKTDDEDIFVFSGEQPSTTSGHETVE